MAAAATALAYVEEGMVLGLGTGSTAECFLHMLAGRIKSGLRIEGVATSRQSGELALRLGISTVCVDSKAIDLDIDGADEIDPSLNLLKGGGGALLREKIVALAAARMLVIGDESKLVNVLTENHPLPVEVVEFGWMGTQRRIEALGGQVSRRRADTTWYVTDGGNAILDVVPPTGEDPITFGARVRSTTGVVDHGIFAGIATLAVIGRPDGSTFCLPAFSTD